MKVPEDRALAHLLGFAPMLRAHGFPASPDRTAAFVAGVGLLGPRGLGDVRAAAAAAFGPAPEDRAAFDALFDRHFLGRVLAPPSGEAEDEDDIRAAEDRPGAPPPVDGEEDAGAEASVAERLGTRALHAARARGFVAPTRPSRRRRAAKRGAPDLRRAAREAMRRDGDLLSLPRRRRRAVPRPVLMLVDVSGSMAALTPDAMAAARAVIRAHPRAECFTLGTRLTRVTRALRLRHEGRALAEAAALVPDWDGGTRLGEALEAFLAVPRFASHARGALVVVVSDGLERGDPAPFVDAVARLGRRAHRLVWLSPLATGPGWAPQTAALQRAARHVDRFGHAGGAAALLEEVRE